MPIDPSIKTLIIDDMLTMRKIISKMLKQFSFTNITEADDGATAWPMIQKAFEDGQPYQLIISDLSMPNMSGLDLLLKVRQTVEIESTPFLMVTAESEQTNVKKAVESGVTDFIKKPFEPETLKEKIERVFSKTN